MQTAHIDTMSLSRCHMSALGRSSLVFLLIAGDQSAADFSHSELVCAQIRLLQGEFFFEREAQGDACVNCTVRPAGETLESKMDQDGVTNGGPGTIVAMGCIGWTSDAACTHVTALSPYNHYIVTYTPRSKF